jgi:hypothetical protein
MEGSMDDGAILETSLRKVAGEGLSEFMFRHWIVGLTACFQDRRTGEIEERYFFTRRDLLDFAYGVREPGTVGEEIALAEARGDRVVRLRDHDGKLDLDRSEAHLPQP